jgi:hypothetical protein
LWSTDHKMIAMQYMFTGMAMALIGGFFAYAFRMNLAFPGMQIPFWGQMTPAEYNAAVTNHGTIMIFWVAMPVLIAAFGNYLIPLMLGCDDMVFPRINRLSYQIFLLSAILLVASFFVEGGGFGGAWTAYPPLSAKSEYNATALGAPMWVIAVGLEFVAFLLGGINFVTTSGCTITRRSRRCWPTRCDGWVGGSSAPALAAARHAAGLPAAAVWGNGGAARARQRSNRRCRRRSRASGILGFWAEPARSLQGVSLSTAHSRPVGR